MEQLAEMPDSDAEIVADETAPAETEATQSEAHDEPQEDQEELIEIERNGKKYAIPKSLEGELLMQSDYTKKTQTVAEERKAVEAEREAIKAEREAAEAERKLNQATLSLAAKREHLAATYQQLEQIDLYALNQQDPVQAQAVLIQKQQVANAFQQVQGQLTQAEQQLANSEQQSLAKLAEKAAAHLAKEVKGWQPNNDVDKALTEYVAAAGVKGPEVSRVIAKFPQFAVMADKARQFDALMAQKATPKPKPEPQAQPVTRITASQGTAPKDPSKMTPEEFAKWRKQAIARRK